MPTPAEAESLLLATGLVAAPDRTTLAGAPGLVPDLKKQLSAALGRDTPDRLYVVKLPGGSGYAKQLAKDPDYEGLVAWLAPRIGANGALAYQVTHQTARQVLLSRRTIITVDTIMGSQVVANDPEADEQWELEAGQVEQMRIVKDLAAGALLKECVDVFRACFPATYGLLVDHLDDELNKRGAKSKTWMPDPYLEDSIRIFLGRKFDDPVQINGPAELPAPGASGGGRKKKSGFDSDELLTTAQKASK